MYILFAQTRCESKRACARFKFFIFLLKTIVKFKHYRGDFLLRLKWKYFVQLQKLRILIVSPCLINYGLVAKRRNSRRRNGGLPRAAGSLISRLFRRSQYFVHIITCFAFPDAGAEQLAGLQGGSRGLLRLHRCHRNHKTRPGQRHAKRTAEDQQGEGNPSHW